MSPFNCDQTPTKTYPYFTLRTWFFGRKVDSGVEKWKKWSRIVGTPRPQIDQKTPKKAKKWSKFDLGRPPEGGVRPPHGGGYLGLRWRPLLQTQMFGVNSRLFIVKEHHFLRLLVLRKEISVGHFFKSYVLGIVFKPIYIVYKPKFIIIYAAIRSILGLHVIIFFFQMQPLTFWPLFDRIWPKDDHFLD